MELSYNEWLPAAVGLRDVVTAYWRVVGNGSQAPPSAVLPDGHVELVCNFGDPVELDGPAFRGLQPDRVVVGPLARAIRLSYTGAVDTFGIRFHPARGAAFFGIAAAALVNQLVIPAQVSSQLDSGLRRLFGAGWNPERENCRTALDGVMLDQLARSLPPDFPVVAMVDRLTSSEHAPRVKDIARELGLSQRQAQRRFVASVGMPPKQFARVIRFSRLWQTASMSPPETWAALAAGHGYADQAHMVRDFRAFGVEPPTRFFSPEWYGSTELSRLSGPAQGARRAQRVRSVQDRVR